MGALPRLIAHHTDGLTLVVEMVFVLLLLALFGGIWLRERRRRVNRSRRVAEMRESSNGG